MIFMACRYRFSKPNTISLQRYIIGLYSITNEVKQFLHNYSLSYAVSLYSLYILYFTITGIAYIVNKSETYIIVFFNAVLLSLYYNIRVQYEDVYNHISYMYTSVRVFC